jgi:hypothetical protein
VKKGDIVYVLSNKKHDKKWLYGHVAGNETLGLMPARVLHKEPDENHVNEDGEERLLKKVERRNFFLTCTFFLSGVEALEFWIRCKWNFIYLFILSVFFRCHPKRTRQIKINSQAQLPVSKLIFNMWPV